MTSCEKPKPEAEFAVSMTEREIGVSLDFVDLSINKPISWVWDFGDGNTSAESSPSHTYTSEGTFTVSLSVSNAYGNDTKTKIDYINVIEPPIINVDGVTDYDGNTYYEVKIGTQIWMAENLKVRHYSDGTAIPHVTDNTTWANLGDNDTDKAYCFFNNDESLGYGVLYTYAAVTNGDNSGIDVQGICPAGWHLPSDAEWTLLEDFINNDEYSGSIGTTLKFTSGWNVSSHSGTDNYGFSALPSGGRNLFGDGSFGYEDYYGAWWSSTENDSTDAWKRELTDGYHCMTRSNPNKSSGLSVRCVKD